MTINEVKGGNGTFACGACDSATRATPLDDPRRSARGRTGMEKKALPFLPDSSPFIHLCIRKSVLTLFTRFQNAIIDF